MIPVLRVVQGQFIDLRNKEQSLHVHKHTATHNESQQHNKTAENSALLNVV